MSKPKKILVDGHVHLYPVYNYAKALKAGMKNISKLSSSPNCSFVFLLTERSDCHFYRDVTESTLASNNDLAIEKNEQDHSLTVKSQKNEQVLYIIAGRQIVSRENLEICALFTDCRIDDRQLSTEELIHTVLGFNGIPVINWAPGKWFGRRGNLVESLLYSYTPKQLWIGDTTMRPQLWPTPTLMKKAQQQGYHLIAGSDPLPFKEEEQMLGSYATLVDGTLDPVRPAASLRGILLSSGKVMPLGKRSRLFTFLRRQSKIMSNKTRR
ncbi:hypothetical protein GF407_12295 [candidate division KSB1 bacterium]|nr:hypothetical protein [candidate division KSB1 bacterium]